MSNTRTLRRIAITVAATGGMTAGGLGLPVAAHAAPDAGETAASCPVPSQADPNVLRIVYRVGRGLRVDDRVMLAGFEAGWVESHMNNLSCGDSDSLGVFQQRPSQGWGTPAQILDVSFAANSFFTRAIRVAADNPGLSAGLVAAEVQRPAAQFRGRYDQAEGTARNLLNQARQLTTGKTTIGFYVGSDASFHLRNSLSAGASDVAFHFGPSGMVPVSGDWNGDGKTTIGFYNPGDGSWHLRDSLSEGPSDTAFVFGGPGYVPVTGDWNGDGKTTVGLYNPTDGTWKLRNSNTAGNADVVFSYGGPAYRPVTGDWNGDGKTTIGLYNPSDSTWRMRNANSAGPSDVIFAFGANGMIPVTGDWNADGKTTVGLYHPQSGAWKVRNTNSAGDPDATFQFGPAGASIPVTGDWDNT